MTARKPRALRRLHGTDRDDREPRADYASRLTKLPPPPPSLSEAAGQIWRDIGAAAIGIGTLTGADLALLALLATTLEAEAGARATLRDEGVATIGGSGGRKAHPAARVAEAACKQAVAIMKELGLTPRARQSVATAPAPAALPWERDGTAGAEPVLSLDDYVRSAPPIPVWREPKH